MNKHIVAIALTITSATAMAGSTASYDALECAKVSQKFYVNQFHMSIGELDLMETCAATMKNMMVSQKENDKEINAFIRNNNQKDAE